MTFKQKLFIIIYAVSHSALPRIAFASESFECGFERAFPFALMGSIVFFILWPAINILVLTFLFRKKDSSKKILLIVAQIIYLIFGALPLFFLFGPSNNIFLHLFETVLNQVGAFALIIPLLLYIIVPIILYKKNCLNKKDITLYFELLAILLIVLPIFFIIKLELFSPSVCSDGKGY